MARTPAQRGRIGTWLVQARLARGYETQAIARREVERLTGWRIPQSQYAEWESGRRVPSEASLERLEAFYGTQTENDATLLGDVALIAAIDRQTQAIVDLAALIREGVDRQAGAFDGLADGMMQLLSQLVSFHADNVDAPARRRVGSQ